MIPALFLSALLCVDIASGQALEGFVEGRVQTYLGVDSDVPVFLVERFRPTFTAPLRDRVLMSTTIEAGMGQGWTTQSAFSDLASSKNLSAELMPFEEETNALLGISGASDYLAVDRLFIEFQLPSSDIRIGRQALNWGSGYVINPSDPFPEVLVTEPWRPRSGVNAARVDVPFGELNTFQVIAGADDSFTHPRLASRLTLNAVGTDFSFVGAWREEIDEGIVGLDLKGTLGVGFWFEGVVHISEPAPRDDTREIYEEFIAGVDYSFPVLEQLILSAQYYRNGSGSKNLDTGASALFETPQPFAPFFRGRDYLIASVSAGLTRDLSASALWVQNLHDGTAFAVPTLTMLAFQNAEFSLAGQLPIALSGSGEFKPSDDALTVQLPQESGTLTTVDLGQLVPATTLIFWTRYNF